MTHGARARWTAGAVLALVFRSARSTLTLALVLSALASTGCDDDGAGAGPGRDADVGVDAEADGDADADAGGDADGTVCSRPCAADCCEAGEVCVEEVCIEETSCADGEPCQGDAYCRDGLCVPYGAPFRDFDETCIREVEPLDAFEPEIQCEWPGEHEIDFPEADSVRIPPLVADLDGDDVPEIIFTSYHSSHDHPTGGAIPFPTVVRAIRGDDCSPVWTATHSQDANQSIALGDLTGDGIPEICGRGNVYVGDAVPYCLDAEGELLWEGHDGSTPAPVAPGRHDVGISMANVDGEGPPEVVVGLSVLDGPTGQLLLDTPTPTWGPWDWTGVIPALADVDGDGNVEAMTGGVVADLVTGDVVDWGTSHGYAAVAELSAEHEGPEVVVVVSGQSRVRVHALDGEVIFEHDVPGGHGGPPTVADLDGDGQAELATAGHRYLTAFDLDCVGTAEDPPDPSRCVAADGAMDGVMWSVATHEYSSGVTGSSVFDFEGDGAVEIVYGDECWTRVFDGRTGAVKFSAPHESITGIEYPVVADVDGDFYSEIVIPHEAYPDGGCPAEDPLAPGVTREPGRIYAGITVYRDRHDRWAPSRPLWSQHTEHFYQRDDEGNVPPFETPSWEPRRYNSYRQAHPPQDVEAYFIPDLTVGRLEAPPCDTAATLQVLSVEVCDRGTLPVAPGVRVSFRLDGPDGVELCSASTTIVLWSGECERVQCVWEGVPLEERHAVHAVVDDGGEDGIAECREDNNTTAADVLCPPPIG